MLETFRHNTDQLVFGIHHCLRLKLILPALILLYTGFDVMGSVESQPGEGTRASFTRWVEKYVLVQGTLPCTALDLYAARCGVLHTFTAEADLVANQKARRIIYAWGTGNQDDLQTAVQDLGKTD